jgi:stage III sporulation protein AG
MDIKGIFKGGAGKLEKYKYAVLVGIVGIALMLLPEFGKKETQTVLPKTQAESAAITVQQELESILSQIKGAGKVRVMLKEQIGEERVYEKNEDITAEATRKDVVTVTDADRNQMAVVKKIISPTYSGAIVLCEGGDDPGVKFALSEAVSKITGLGMDKIVVLKMK